MDIEIIGYGLFFDDGSFLVECGRISLWQKQEDAQAMSDEVFGGDVRGLTQAQIDSYNSLKPVQECDLYEEGGFTPVVVRVRGE